ncbi:MAG: RluA family pseudouridine synthase [Candidatus Eisenbacteria bacterium]
MGENFPSEIEVTPDEGNRRLDLFLRGRLPGVSRAWWKARIEDGQVLRNGRPAKKSDLVAAGDRIDLSRLSPPVEIGLRPGIAEDLVVRYEDESVVVVEKEAGLPTIPKNGEETNALACRLVARFPELRSVGKPLEAGLLHRLDTGTSGLLVAARNDEAYARLREQWRWRRVEKEYVALVAGAVERPFTVLLPIGHHPKSAKRMVAGKGRTAETCVRPVWRGARVSVVIADLREGRRHQIRLHLAESGHPVIGDPLYGRVREGKERGSDGPRLMLHAFSIRFRVDPEGEPIRVLSEPPEDFTGEVRRRLGREGVEAMLRDLRRGSPGR